jgi:hypothetical protein
MGYIMLIKTISHVYFDYSTNDYVVSISVPKDDGRFCINFWSKHLSNDSGSITVTKSNILKNGVYIEC